MDEEFGLGALLGGVKLFKRFLPAKLRLPATIGVAGIGLVTALGNTVFAPAPILADFEMTSADLTVQAACISNYGEQDFEFNSGQSFEIGCACTAKLATSVIQDSEYDVFGQAHNLMLKRWNAEYSAKTNADMDKINSSFDSQYRAAAVKAGLDQTRFDEVMGVAYAVDSVCDEMSTYRSKSLANISQLRPMGYQAEPQVTADPQNDQGVSVTVHNDDAEQTAKLRIRKGKAY